MAQIMDVKILTFFNFSDKICFFLWIAACEDPILILLIFGNFDETHRILPDEPIDLFARNEIIILFDLMPQNSLKAHRGCRSDFRELDPAFL